MHFYVFYSLKYLENYCSRVCCYFYVVIAVCRYTHSPLGSAAAYISYDLDFTNI